MKKAIYLFSLLSLGFISCEDEDSNDTCMTCSAVVTTTWDGELQSEINVSPTDICGSQLESILNSPNNSTSVTTSYNTGTMIVEVVQVSVYTCQ